MNTHLIATAAARAERNICKSTKETYLLSVDAETNKLLYTAIIGIVTCEPDKQARRKNMVMIQRHAGTLNWLRKLTPEQINNAAPDIARAMEVLIDLNILKDILTTNKHLSGQRDKQLEQCRWMVEHGARNNMIQAVCYLLVESDIRQIRTELGINSQLGRCGALPLEDQLTVQDYWQRMKETESDTFQRYRQLQEAFPQYDLGRLNAAINGI